MNRAVNAAGAWATRKQPADVRLLVVTQRVDLNSDVLGFFHAWLVELAARFDTVVTVTLSAAMPVTSVLPV